MNCRVDLKAYVTLVFMLFVPSLYLLVRMHLLGEIPSDEGINIASQIMWVGVLYEVLQEALFLPLYSLLGRHVKNLDLFFTHAKEAFFITIVTFTCFSAIVYSFAHELCTLMGQQQAILASTVDYVRLESIANITTAASKFGMLVLIVLGASRIILILTLAQTFFHILSDAFFIGKFSFSVHWGVNGLAASTFVVQFFVCVILFLLLWQKYCWSYKSFRPSFSFNFLLQWGRIGIFSGLESLLRNIVFAVVILRMMNMVSDQGNFWLANNFIWGGLLLPILALSELIKRDVAQDKKAIAYKTIPYFLIVLGIVSCWFISMPWWTQFIKNTMNVQDVETVLWIIKFQLPFYILFALLSVIQSIFYGLGRTDYILWQSIVVNVLYYGAIFFLYTQNTFSLSLLSILLIFGGGFIVGAFPTLYLFKKLLKQEKLRIKNPFKCQPLKI